MKITFTSNPQSAERAIQARAEQSFSSGDAHGDFCLTAYGETRDQARANLRDLALQMVRELERVKSV